MKQRSNVALRGAVCTTCTPRCVSIEKRISELIFSKCSLFLNRGPTAHVVYRLLAKFKMVGGEDRLHCGHVTHLISEIREGPGDKLGSYQENNEFHMACESIFLLI